MLFTSVIMAQDKGRYHDTLYVAFDESVSYDDLHLKIAIQKFSDRYIFQFPDNKVLAFDVRKTEKIIKKRKKHIKSKITTIQKIHDNGFDESLKFQYGRKVIYIIQEKNKRKYSLKRAQLQNTILYEM